MGSFLTEIGEGKYLSALPATLIILLYYYQIQCLRGPQRYFLAPVLILGATYAQAATII